MTFKVASKLADKSGNVGLMTAFLLVPLILIAGVSIDYAHAVNKKRKLDATIDAAVLAGVRRAAELDQAGAKDWVAQAKKTAAYLFQANASVEPRLSKLAFDTTFTKTNGTYTGTASYTADVATFIMGIFGRDFMPIASTAKSSTTSGSYLHIHFVIDNSASMGIGAEESDWIKMRGATPDQCAFACHQSSAYSEDVAHAVNARLRIDVVRDAMINVVKSIKTQVGTDKSVKVTIHTFSNVLKSGTASADLDQVITSLNALGLVTGTGGGTYINYSLKALNTSLPQGGTGASAADPKGYIVIFSDGIEDSPSFPTNANGGTFAPGPTWVNNPLGYEDMADTTRLQSFDPGLCAPFKTKNYTVLAAQIKYVKSSYLYRSKPILDAQRDQIKIERITTILAPRVLAAFKACASAPEYAVLATKSSEIEPKLQILVDAIIDSKTPSLTQ